MFLSDNVKELDASLAAGMHSFLVDRSGNAPLSEGDKDRFNVLNSLTEIKLTPEEQGQDPDPSGAAAEPSKRQSQRLKVKAIGRNS